jgi:antitoxin HigA-1
MIPTNRLPIHPGEVLLEEFLKPSSVSQLGLAKHLDIPVQRINELVRGKRGITADTAWMLGQAFGTSPEFWANLQTNYDLARCDPRPRKKRLSIKKI